METNRITDWQGPRLSRRGLLRAAAAAAVGSAGLAAGCGGGSSNAPVRGPVAQQKQLRIRTGLTGWDPEQTSDGLTLFAPNRGTGAYLVDMDGEVVHEWAITDPEGPASVWNVELLENGNLFVIAHQPAGDAPPFVFKGGVLMELDWDGTTVWQVEDEHQHHDARVLPNGNLLVLRTELVPAEIEARVPGGLPNPNGSGMWGDWVAETTRDGETVWEWHASDHLEPERYPLNGTDQRNEWTHGNSIEQGPAGNVLVSFRNINTVIQIAPRGGDILWTLGPPTLAQQHHASFLPNGNVLIFDNGAHRLDSSIPNSRVIEVVPENDEIVWEYRDPYVMNFFSPFISGAQRLPNGNTLITEGIFGRVFEVSPRHEIVWEYINPFLAIDAVLGENNAIFRANRYARDRFPQL